jgi:hypothetical protein
VKDRVVLDRINKVNKALRCDTGVGMKDIGKVLVVVIKKQAEVFLGLWDVMPWLCTPILVEFFNGLYEPVGYRVITRIVL